MIRGATVEQVGDEAADVTIIGGGVGEPVAIGASRIDGIGEGVEVVTGAPASEGLYSWWVGFVWWLRFAGLVRSIRIRHFLFQTENIEQFRVGRAFNIYSFFFWGQTMKVDKFWGAFSTIFYYLQINEKYISFSLFF